MSRYLAGSTGNVAKVEERKSITETIPVPEQGAETSNNSVVTHVLTSTESNLIRMSNNQDAFDWDKAMKAVEILDDYSLTRDPLELPPECKARVASKEFRYRWLDPDDKDRFNLQVSGAFPWVLATRNNAPYISDHLRDENGLVRNAGMVLAVMRYDLYMARQTQIWKMSGTTELIGPAKGGTEYTGKEGGKIKGGDIVVAEEIVREDPLTMTTTTEIARSEYVAGTD